MSNNVTIGAKIAFDTGDATKSVGSIKTQLRNANQELLNAQENFGEFSAEAIGAAKRVAELKDTIGDAASLADAFNPDKKFVAVGQAINGITGGFAAVTGVMGLLGSESEAVEKTLLKVQSALAISQGVDSLLDGIQGFKNLSTVVRNSTLFIKANEIANKATAASMRLFGISVQSTAVSFKVLKGAIVATGIGALLIVLGLVIEKIVAWVDSTNDAEAANNALADSIERVNRDLDLNVKAIQQATARQLAYAKIAGKSEKELQEIRQRGASDEIQALLAAYEAKDAIYQRATQLDGVTLEQLKTYQKEATEAYDAYLNRLNQQGQDELEFKATQADKERQEAKAKADKEKNERKSKLDALRKQREQEVEEARKLNEELRRENDVTLAGGGQKSELEKLRQEYDDKVAILKKGNHDLIEAEEWYRLSRAAIINKYDQEEREKFLEKIDEQIARDAEYKEQLAASIAGQLSAHRDAAAQIAADEALTLEERRLAIDIAEQSILANTRLTEEQRTALEANFTQARIDIAQAERDAKAGFYADMGSALGAFTAIVGKETAAGKALAIAQATINTWLGVTEVLKTKSVLPEPMATIARVANIAAVVATGIGAVKNILKTQVAGASSGGSVSASMGAPLTPSVSNSVTSLDRNTINQLGSGAVKAYVTETDITNNQEKVKRINRAARIG